MITPPSPDNRLMYCPKVVWKSGPEIPLYGVHDSSDGLFPESGTDRTESSLLDVSVTSAGLPGTARIMGVGGIPVGSIILSPPRRGA